MAKPSPPPDRPPARRLGGRSARVREAVLDATLALLSERGFDGFSIAEVAARSGVHETSIYRRWGSPANLITEASLLFADREIPLPDTGSLRGDLVEMHREGLAFATSPLGHILLGWMMSAPNLPAYNEVIAGYWDRRSTFLAAMFDRARARGEWTSGEDIQSILPRLIGPFYFRHFFRRHETATEDLETIVDDFLASERADAISRTC